MTMQAGARNDTHDAQPLSKSLKLATHSAHQAVDDAMMALSPFADIGGYRRFLAVQYCIHRAAVPLYRDTTLQGWIPELVSRCRYADIVADCRDMGIDLVRLNALSDESLPSVSSPYEALGWLYTNEGSNLGAAILFKHARAMGMTETYGARHLAGRSEGRANHWREFVTHLDDVPLTAQQHELVLSGGRGAFSYVHTIAQRNAGLTIN